MFRVVMFAVGVLVLVIAAAAAFAGWPTIPLAVFGAILVMAMLVERYVYKSIRQEAPGRGWEQTEERFIDPKSGQGVIVYFNPRTGERRYVGDNNSGNDRLVS